jgi:motility quorum-sensing regulator/GCU-specific mRNA interferase toxin
MTEKRKPAYDLSKIQIVFNHEDRLNITVTARRTAKELGFDGQGIVNVIQTMKRLHFYKSMTSHYDHKIWQDVYHVPSEKGLLYVKFTEDAVTEFILLSFKEK